MERPGVDVVQTTNREVYVHKSHVMQTKMKFGFESIRVFGLWNGVEGGCEECVCGDADNKKRTYVKN